MTERTMLQRAKVALRITTDAYDDEIDGLIAAAERDLQIAGIRFLPNPQDALIRQAILTYVRAHFSSPADYEKLKAAYDEQKAQLQTASGYGLECDYCDL